MFSLRKELLTVFSIFFGTFVSLLILWQYNHPGSGAVFFTSAAPLVSLTPTIAKKESIEVVTDVSPDGTSRLMMIKQQKETNTSYSLLASAVTDSQEKPIFSKTIDHVQNWTIPYNTWSPENNYLFLKESTPTGNNYYVFNTNGNLFPDGAQFINVSELFNLKITDYTLTEITGWADPNLLIINTKTKQGQQGPSFWFEIPSRSFIQLSTHFG